MISRRNYLLVTSMILVLLFLFQATGVARDTFNNFTVNPYGIQETALGEEEAFSPDEVRKYDENSYYAQNKPDDAIDYHGRTVFFVGYDKDNGVYDTVRQWCTYTKRTLKLERNPGKIKAKSKDIEVVVVDSKTTDVLASVEEFTKLANKGVAIIFANLPEVSKIRANSKFQELLGITDIKEDEVEITGIKVFSNLLYGGDVDYFTAPEVRNDPATVKRNDLKLNIPWYQTMSLSKSYAIGTRDDIGDGKDKKYTYTNAEAPRILWSSQARPGSVYVVNGDYIEDVTGIGILEGFMGSQYNYELYPIVNAQNFTVVNYPSFANENTPVLMRYYSRNLTSIYRDIIWQSLSEVTGQTRFKMTSLVAPQMDYTDEAEPSETNLEYFAKLLNEQQSEIGLSLVPHSNTALKDKLSADAGFYNEHFKNYIFRCSYIDEEDEFKTEAQNDELLSKVTTVTRAYDPSKPLLGYIEGKTYCQATNDAIVHNYSDDFRTRSIESVLGYTNVLLDLEDVAFPESKDDNWNMLYEDFSGNMMNYWRDYEKFDFTVLSQNDTRVRRFLSLDYQTYRTDDQIVINLIGFDKSAYLMLRLGNEKPVECQGCTAVDMGEGYYRLDCTEDYIVVNLGKTEGAEIK